MHKVRFTPEARADLDDIVLYTIDRYGLKQAREYRGGFEKLFSLLAEHRLMGSDQSGIQPNLRRIVHQSHTIYYRVAEHEVTIARILGPGQDPLEELL